MAAVPKVGSVNSDRWPIATAPSADPPGRTSRSAVWAPGDSILQHMGRRNYLIEGLSGTGKTSVCDELQRRGHHAIHGDRELAYRGDPETGEPMEGFGHEHHIWDVEKVRSLVADRSHAATFFCGGSRNFSKFMTACLPPSFGRSAGANLSHGDMANHPGGRPGAACGVDCVLQVGSSAFRHVDLG